MTKPNERQRRANWPGIEASIRAYGKEYVSPKNKAAMRRYYIEGVKPKLSFLQDGECPALIVRLMCEPHATEATWKRWKNELSISHLGGARRSFVKLQQNTNVYMGTNSPFGGREKQIYDYFFKKVGKSLNREITKEDIYALADSDLRHLIKDIGVIKLAKHSQVSREIDWFVRQGVEHRTTLHHRNENNEDDNHTYAKAFCPIAIAHTHPGKFDPRLKYSIRKLFKLLGDSKVSPLLQNTFNESVTTSMNRYAEETGAGGLVSVSLRYNSKAQLQAVLPVLSPGTRFPFDRDTPEDRVVGLPIASVGNRQNRPSYRAISYLWKSGLVADHISQIDDKTVFIQFKAPLCVP